MARRIAFRTFRTHGFAMTFGGVIEICDQCKQEAADFASTIPPENLVNVSEGDEGNRYAVTVWYWDE